MTGRLKESGFGRPAFLGSANSRDGTEGPGVKCETVVTSLEGPRTNGD